jgi:hypothetical protein
MNLASLVQNLSELRSRKKAFEKEIKELDSSISDLESDIIKAMDAEGIEQSVSNHVRVKINEATYPHVENWDQFYDFIYENRYFHLLEKRPTAVAYRELLSLNQRVPGVVPFVKRKLSYSEV